jgi:hypothetical protein
VTAGTDLATGRPAARQVEIAASLRAQWRMIAAVSLRPHRHGEGFEAVLRLDPIVVKGSLEQQGYPRSRAALVKAAARREAAIEDCVRQVNAGLAAPERINGFTIEA